MAGERLLGLSLESGESDFVAHNIAADSIVWLANQCIGSISLFRVDSAPLGAGHMR